MLKLYTTIKGLILVAVFFAFGAFAQAQSVVTKYINNFDGNSVDTTWKPEHATDTPKVFILTQTNGLLKVHVDKNTGIDAGMGWYGFSSLSLDLSNTEIINMAANPVVRIRIKADTAFTFSFGVSQADSATNNLSLAVEIPGDNTFHTYQFDFTGMFAGKYDSTLIDKFYLNFNPGWAAGGKYAGTVTFDFLKIGDAAAPLPSGTSYVDNFDGSAVSALWAPEHAADVPTVFTLTQADGAMKVVVDKNTGIDAGMGWYGFSALALDMSTTEAINMAGNPLVKVRLKADAAFTLGVGPIQAENGGNDISQNVSVPGDGAYHTYLFDFTDKFGNKYDSTLIDKFYLNFNPGWAAGGKYVGTVTFDFLKIGDAAAPLPSGTSYVDNFDGSAVSALWAPEHAADVPTVFTLTQADGALKVVVDKNTGIDAGMGWYGFSALALDMSTTAAINMAGNPLVKVRLKADAAFTLGVGPIQAENGGNDISQNVSVPGDGAYHTYLFDFTGKFGSKYDSTQIDKFYLNFNPGWAASGKYAGTVTFDFLKIGDAAALLPSVTSFTDNFDGSAVSALWAPEHAADVPTVFTLTQADGAMKVVVDKNTGIDAGMGWYGFSALALDKSTTESINMAANPFIKVRLKADAAFTLGVGPIQAENGGNDISQSVSVPGDGAYHTYLFDFTGKFGSKYDSTQIDKFYLNFNPGWAAAGKYAGTVTFDFLKIGDAAALLPSVTSFTDNFDGSAVSALWAPEHAADVPTVFTLTQADGAMKVVVDKNTGIDAGMGWYGFSALALNMSTTEAINMAGNPFIEVRLKADAAFTLGVGPIQAENGGNDISQNVSVTGDGEYHTYLFDFTGKFGNKYDSTLIDKFYLNFNPGWAAAGKYAGIVTFDFLKIGDAAVSTGFTQTNKFNGLVVYPNPATRTISLKNVALPEVNLITITNMNGQIMKQIDLYNGDLINVEELKAGIYNLSIVNKDNTLKTIRFIKR